jgi:hypothetical protein
LTPHADAIGVRIALVTDTYLPQINGVTTVVRRIADTTRAAGHVVAVVAPRYPHGSGGTAERSDLRSENQELLRQYGALAPARVNPPSSHAVSPTPEGVLHRC